MIYRITFQINSKHEAAVFDLDVRHKINAQECWDKLQKGGFIVLTPRPR